MRKIKGYGNLGGKSKTGNVQNSASYMQLPVKVKNTCYFLQKR